MRRFFTEPENINGDEIRIIEDAAHITRVLRMNVGDEIVVFDGSGTEYFSKLISVGAKECLAKVFEKTVSELEPKMKISIFQGLPKTGKMESIIQKAVELGVYEIVPVMTARSVVRIEGKSGAEKTKRWNKISLEAAKQCGRSVIPRVLAPITFDEALLKMQKLDLPIMPYEELGHMGSRGLKELLCAFDGSSVGVIIGPEGGFSDKEAEMAKQLGIHTVGLGKRILRTETVASTIASIIMYEKDEI